MIQKTSQIRTLINSGRLVEAEIALELFLKFGPNNLEALKLKAQLFSQKGFFAKEYEMWVKIATLAPEEPKAHEYFDLHFLEEKEKFYFTDLLPQGGRRFLLHPRALLESCGAGFVSCLIFLVLGQLPVFSSFLGLPFVSFLLILLFILTPWAGILYAYMKMPGDVWVSTNEFGVSTRLKKHQLLWTEISDIYVVHELKKHAFSLYILILPKDKNKEFIRIEISEDASIVKARRFFLTEILSYYSGVKYLNKKPKGLSGLKFISF